MNPSKLICQSLARLARSVWALPKTIANISKERQLRAAFNEREAERLDRIRNPSKYWGK
jgi:hypothetical protein